MIIRGLGHLSSEDRLKESGLFSWGRLQRDLLATFQYLTEIYRKAGEGLVVMRKGALD